MYSRSHNVPIVCRIALPSRRTAFTASDANAKEHHDAHWNLDQTRGIGFEKDGEVSVLTSMSLIIDKHVSQVSLYAVAVAATSNVQQHWYSSDTNGFKESFNHRGLILVVLQWLDLFLPITPGMVLRTLFVLLDPTRPCAVLNPEHDWRVAAILSTR